MTIAWTVTWAITGQQGPLAAAPSTTTFLKVVDEVATVITDLGATAASQDLSRYYQAADPGNQHHAERFAGQVVNGETGG